MPPPPTQLPALNKKTYQILVWVTACLALVVFFWGLGALPLLTFNEARRAIPASIMFSSGDWLLPRMNGELYLAKPPLFYWAIAGISTLAGTFNEWTMRIPSAISATAIVAMTYRFGLRRFGPWPALFAALILITNMGFSMLARRAQIEMLLAALCFAALLSALKYIDDSAHRRWIWSSYLLLGLAALTKWPLCLIFVTLPLLVNAVYQKKPRNWDVLRDPVDWVTFLITGSSWYLATTWQLGPDVWLHTLQKDIVSKVHSVSGEPFYSYILWLLGDFFPASLILLLAPVFAWRSWKNHAASMTILISAAVPLIVYTAFSDKHAKYLLPIYPFIALLIGKLIGEWFLSASPSIRKALLASSLLLLVGYAGFYSFAEARLFKYRYDALIHFQRWLPSVGKQPLYGYQHIDERVIYYARRDIPMLDQASLQKLIESKTSFQLLVENPDNKLSDFPSACLMINFKPYLKTKDTLAVYGFGNACEKSSGLAHN